MCCNIIGYFDVANLIINLSPFLSPSAESVEDGSEAQHGSRSERWGVSRDRVRDHGYAGRYVVGGVFTLLSSFLKVII